MIALATFSRIRVVRSFVRAWNRRVYGRQREALAQEISAALGEPVTAHHMTNTTLFRRADGRGGSLAVHYWKRPSPASIAQFLRTNAGKLS